MSRKRSKKANEEAIRRGQDAKSLMDDPILTGGLNFIEKLAIDTCLTAKTPDEAFYGTLRAQAIQSVRGLLRAYVADGENAARELEEEMSARRRKREDDRAYENYLTAARQARSTHDHLTTATRENRNG